MARVRRPRPSTGLPGVAVRAAGLVEVGRTVCSLLAGITHAPEISLVLPPVREGQE